MGNFDQFDQDAVIGPRVDEGHPGVAGAPPRLLVDEDELVLPGRRERRLDALDLVGDVVEPLAPAGDEPSDGGIGRERGDELQVGVPEAEHGLLDALLRHDLAVGEG